MATTAANRKNSSGPRMSLDLASQLFDWSSVALAIGACIVFVATAAIVWLGIVKEHHWELLREHANEKIAAVGLETAKANAELGTAQADIAKAQATAATANLEAARLRFELDREVQKRSPRTLTDAQKEVLSRELKGKLREVTVVTQQDMETKYFAMQLSIAFSEAGATIHPHDLAPGETVTFPAGVGMHKVGGVNTEDGLLDDPLYRALKAASLFGGLTSKPFATLHLTPATPTLPYAGYIVYVGQKLPW